MKVLALTLAVTILVVMCSVGNAAEDPSLVLCLCFDDGSGEVATDSSQYGNDGDLMGGPEWVDGKFGGALQFDGVDDFVQVPHAAILTVDNEVTVMAWINTETHGGDGGYQGIVAKSNSPRSYSLYTEGGGQKLHFSTAGIGTVSSTTIPLNEWVHVAAVVVDGGHKYYLNGAPDGVGGAGIVLPGVADTANVLVGKTHEGTRELLGMIDEVRIWNRALDEAEINDQMNTGCANGSAVEATNKLAATWGTLKNRF